MFSVVASRNGSGPTVPVEEGFGCEASDEPELVEKGSGAARGAWSASSRGAPFSGCAKEEYRPQDVPEPRRMATMKLRSDPWLIVGLILSLLLGVYNGIMEWRKAQPPEEGIHREVYEPGVDPSVWPPRS